MEAKQFTVIPGLRRNGKTTLILLGIVALGLYLLGFMLSDLLFTVQNLDLQLCDLRRKLARIPTGVPPLKFTGTVSITPEPPPTVAYAPPPPADERTENT